MSEKYPIGATAEARANFEYSKKTITEITDHKNFPPRTNKTETIGRILKKTYDIVCDGQGKMMFIRLGGKSMKYHEIISAMKELKETYDIGLTTAEEYEKLRKQLVDQLNKVWH